MSAIVLDGHLKSALAVVRSLGRKGVTVSVGAERGTAMALNSRYTQHRFIYSSPYAEQSACLENIKREAERLGGRPVIYAMSDVTWSLLFTHRKELENIVTILYPNQKSVDIAFDKAATYSQTRVCGVPAVPTHTPDSREEVAKRAHDITYPAVIKPRRSVTWNEGKWVFGTATFVHTEEELLERYTVLREKTGEAPLIQPYVRGEEYGVEMLVESGECYAMVTHHRLRSLSPTGGASVLKTTLESGELKDELERYAQKMARELLWEGPMMIEFKVDSDSRTPLLMEINGRFWGSLPLAVAAGVDMPYLYYQYLAEGQKPDACVRGQGGVTTNHLMGSAAHLLRVFIGRDRMRRIAYPSRLRAIKEFLFLPRGTKSDVWSWDDPLPAWMEFVDILTRVWK